MGSCKEQTKVRFERLLKCHPNKSLNLPYFELSFQQAMTPGDSAQLCKCFQVRYYLQSNFGSKNGRFSTGQCDPAVCVRAVLCSTETPKPSAVSRLPDLAHRASKRRERRLLAICPGTRESEGCTASNLPASFLARQRYDPPGTGRDFAPSGPLQNPAAPLLALLRPLRPVPTERPTRGIATIPRALPHIAPNPNPDPARSRAASPRRKPR
jgi:hypothetical protein